MKKDYDLAKVENELKGASAFFKPPSSPATGSEPNDLATLPTAASLIPGVRTTQVSRPAPEAKRPPVRSGRPGRPVRRQMIRHPFELYQDQVESLRQLAGEDRMHGGAGSMSAMVRQAIDRLLDEASNTSD